MKIAVMGTGMVGEALATKLVDLGHEVMMGSRAAGNEKGVAWVNRAGAGASQGDFRQAAIFGEVVVVAVLGSAVLDTVRQAGPENLAGKTVIDVTNPLSFSGGMFAQLIPELINTTSLGEEVQKLLPKSNVVKALNTMSCSVMVNPALVPGDHDVFLCGDDETAKAKVTGLLKEFGWRAPVDLGPLSAARGTEMLMPFWLRLWKLTGTTAFNYNIARAGDSR